MSELNAPTMGQKNFNGEYGNSSAAHVFIDLAAAPIGTVINFGEFSPGTRIDDIKAITKNLGAGTSLELGVSFPTGEVANDADKFLAITTTADKTTRYDGVPEYFEHGFILTGTVKGGAATGRVDLLVDYAFVGK